MERKAPPPHHAPHAAQGHHAHHAHGAQLAHDGAQSRRWLVLLAMTGSLAMIFVDMTVVGVALPRIGSAVGMGDTEQTWIVTSYLLTLASLMAIVVVVLGLGHEHGGLRRPCVRAVVFVVVSLLLLL